MGCLFLTLSGEEIEREVRLDFPTSNNKAEYEALIFALEVASGNGVKEIQIFTDSEQVINQYRGSIEARDEQMNAYLDVFRSWDPKFGRVSVTQVSRNDVKSVDALPLLSATIEVDGKRTMESKRLEKPIIDLPSLQLKDM